MRERLLADTFLGGGSKGRDNSQCRASDDVRLALRFVCRQSTRARRSSDRSVRGQERNGRYRVPWR